MRFQNVIDEVTAHFKTHFPDVEIPRIVWNPRMRTTGGKVTISRALGKVLMIELNPNLLIDEAKVKRTFTHELAHVADFYIYRKIGHGRTWIRCMQILGAPPERCHQYDTSHLKRRHKRVATAQCQCKTHQLTAYRANKMKIGVRYRCSACRQPLVIVAEVSATGNSILIGLGG